MIDLQTRMLRISLLRTEHSGSSQSTSQRNRCPPLSPLVVLNSPALLVDTILACLCHRKLAENIGENTAFDGALFSKSAQMLLLLSVLCTLQVNAADPKGCGS